MYQVNNFPLNIVCIVFTLKVLPYNDPFVNLKNSLVYLTIINYSQFHVVTNENKLEHLSFTFIIFYIKKRRKSMLKNKRWDSPLLDPLYPLLRVWGYKTKTLNLKQKAKFELKLLIQCMFLQTLKRATKPLKRTVPFRANAQKKLNLLTV